MQELEPGAILDGRYQILEEIGRGAHSIVYKARHQLMQRVVALKVLRSEEARSADGFKRFTQEAKAVSSLSHQNIITIYDFGADQLGHPYLAMDYLKGGSLADLLAKMRILPAERAVPVFLQVCDALAYAHDNAVIHRDLKPGNIMLTGETREFVKLVDFGIAKFLPGSQLSALASTSPGTVLGNPLYMSPEQARLREPDARSDLYSFGCVMYETLTGAPPARRETGHETSASREISCGQASSQVPAALREILCKALEEDPAKRFQTAGELRQKLAEVYGRLKPEKRVWDPHVLAGSATRSLPDGAGKFLLSAVSIVAILSIFFAVWTQTDSGKISLLQMKVRLFESLFSNDPSLPGLKRQLAGLYESRKMMTEALEQRRETLTLVTDRSGTQSWEGGWAQVELAQCYLQQGRIEEAERILKPARVLLIEKIKAIKNPKERLPYYYEILQPSKQTLPVKDADLSSIYNHIFDTKLAAGDKAGAEEVCKSVLKDKGSAESFLAADMLDLLASLALKEKRISEARAVFVRELKMRERISKGRDYDKGLIGPLENLAVIDFKEKNYKPALAEMERAIDLRKIWSEPLSDNDVSYARDLAFCQLMLGKPAAARQTCLNIVSASNNAADPAVAQVLTELSDTYVLQGKHSDAERLLKKIFSASGKGNPMNASNAAALANLSAFYAVAKEDGKVRDFLARAMSQADLREAAIEALKTRAAVLAANQRDKEAARVRSLLEAPASGTLK